MIDMHSHMLPGIDDGAHDMHEALQLLRMAAVDGVTTQVLTPHLHPGRYDNTLASIRAACERLHQCAADAEIPIDIEFAAEIRICPEIIRLVENDEVPWLGCWDGRRTLLLEFPHQTIPVGGIDLVQWLLKRDVVPMIAHPERNREIQQEPNKLDPFLDLGCRLQITAASLLGDFGPVASALGFDLLRRGLVSLIATDSHNTTTRPPKLSAGVKAAAAVVGYDAAIEMVTTTPRRWREGLAAGTNARSRAKNGIPDLVPSPSGRGAG